MLGPHHLYAQICIVCRVMHLTHEDTSWKGLHVGLWGDLLVWIFIWSPLNVTSWSVKGWINRSGETPPALRWLTPVVILRSLSALQEFMCLIVLHSPDFIALCWNLCSTSLSQRNKYPQHNLHRSRALTRSNICPFPISIRNTFQDQDPISNREKHSVWVLFSHSF